MNASEYAKYVESVNRFHQENNIKGGCFGPSMMEGRSFFSWQPCECCKRPTGGTREEYQFAIESGGTFTADICTDCVQYLTYGELDDVTMLEISQNRY